MKEAEALLHRLKQKQYKPIYLLLGITETYFVDLISNYIENNVLTENEKAFNLSIFYGKDTEVDELINACKRFPMMAEYQVIIVREAQDLKKIDRLKSYINQPQATTILVLCYKYKKIDGRKKMFKTIKSNFEFFETPKIYESHISTWINSSLKKEGYHIDPKACNMLIEYLGDSMTKIDKELEKLRQILPTGTTIVPEHVQDYVGISKDYNNFELVNAIGRKDEFKAQRIAKYFKENPKNNPSIVTIGMIYSFFNKLLIYHALPKKDKFSVAKALKVNPYFANDYIHAGQKYNLKSTSRIISLIREADAHTKGIDSSQSAGQDVLRPLLYKIMRS